MQNKAGRQLTAHVDMTAAAPVSLKDCVKSGAAAVAAAATAAATG